jgi:PAS domain S-box-containing protein
VVIAVAGGLTLVLAITRLADSLDRHSRALMRERGLREAGAALVAAADVPEVDVAVRAAVRSLLPEGLEHRMMFATDDRELAMQALPPAGTSHPRSWWSTDQRPYDTTATFETTLVCPLWLEPLEVARPRGGALVLMSRRDALTVTRDALEVLAAQATLALDRIALVEAVGLRDSDHYLRAVVRNTNEIMLIADDDHRIRYASPGLAVLLGTELAPFAALGDIVDADDHAHLRRALNDGAEGRVYCMVSRPDGRQVPVEALFRDLRGARLVQGFVLTLRDVTEHHERARSVPHRDPWTTSPHG